VTENPRCEAKEEGVYEEREEGEKRKKKKR